MLDQIKALFQKGARLTLVADYTTPAAGHAHCPIEPMLFPKGMTMTVVGDYFDHAFLPTVLFDQEHEALRRLNHDLDVSYSGTVEDMPASKALMKVLWIEYENEQQHAELLRCFKPN